MLSFAVFEQSGAGTGNAGGAARDWPLRHAYLTGPDDSPVHGSLRFIDGMIRCEKRQPDAAGLCVQFPVEPSPLSPDGHAPGLLALQTCLLPEREQPYLLSLELARHRLMLSINKLEDWLLFDLPAEDPVMQAFEEARQAFTAAVVAQGVGTTGSGANLRYSPEADRLGRKALALALDASEQIAFRQAQLQHAKRASGELAAAAATFKPPANALTDHETLETRNTMMGSVGVILTTPALIGCTVAPEQFSAPLQQLIARTCDFIRLPMRWVEMEPTEGRYAFQSTDRWIEWAVRTAKLPVVAGPIVDFRPQCTPEWLYIWEHDYETLRELVYEHVKNIVTRYRRTVAGWTVVSGLHCTTNFSLTIEQALDLTRICVTLVRKLQPGAAVQIEIDHPWGDTCAGNGRAVPPTLYAEMINQAGLNPDMIALRIQAGSAEPGRTARDMMSLSAILDRYAALEKPISISAVAAPSQPPSLDDLASAEVDDPGYWRSPWSPDAQARWLTAMAAVAASKPYVHSICWADLLDSPKLRSHDGLLTADGQPKPALQRLAELRQAIREKRSPLSLAR